MQIHVCLQLTPLLGFYVVLRTLDYSNCHNNFSNSVHSMMVVKYFFFISKWNLFRPILCFSLKLLYPLVIFFFGIYPFLVNWAIARSWGPLLDGGLNWKQAMNHCRKFSMYYFSLPNRERFFFFFYSVFDRLVEAYLLLELIFNVESPVWDFTVGAPFPRWLPLAPGSACVPGVTPFDLWQRAGDLLLQAWKRIQPL